MAAKKQAGNILLSVIEEIKKEKTQAKSRRTLFLSNEPFEDLQAYCDKAGLSVSEVVDKWIVLFLDSLKK